MDQQEAQTADSAKNSSETAPLLVEEEESHVEPVVATIDSTAGNQLTICICCLRPFLGGRVVLPTLRRLFIPIPGSKRFIFLRHIKDSLATLVIRKYAIVCVCILRLDN